MKKVEHRKWYVIAADMDGSERVETHETPAMRDPSYDVKREWAESMMTPETVSVRVENLCHKCEMLVQGPMYRAALAARRRALGID